MVVRRDWVSNPDSHDNKPNAPPLSYLADAPHIKTMNTPCHRSYIQTIPGQLTLNYYEEHV